MQALWVAWAFLLAASRCVTETVLQTGDEPSEPCPPCGLLFSRLEIKNDGRRAQRVDVQERGEPKSGTTFILEWAGESLIQACDYLKQLFGEESCDIEMEFDRALKVTSLTFRPSRVKRKARCVCDDIDSVVIELNAYDKHKLPVEESCRWQHPQGMMKRFKSCTFEDGSEPSGYEDLVRCMEEATCNLTESRDQIVVFRDPRGVAVSSYYFRELHDAVPGWTVDEFALNILSTLCQWVAIRFILFERMSLDTRAISFWYDDTLAEPVRCHRLLQNFLGLRLPESVVQAAANVTARGHIPFFTKGSDIHRGGQEEAPGRSYVHEIKEETRVLMDGILVKWIPPLICRRFNITTSSP